MKSLRGFRAFLIALNLIAFSARSEPSIEPVEPLSNAERVGGLLIGSFVGFGTGHMIQNRMNTHGWITIAEFSALFVAASGLIGCKEGLGSLFIVGSNFKDPNVPPEANRSGCKLVTAGSAAFMLLRAYEILDLFSEFEPVDLRPPRLPPKQARLRPALRPGIEPDGSVSLQFLLSF